MDTEISGEVLDVSQTPQQEETVMEKEVVSKLDPPGESTEPEKPPAAAAAEGEPEQLAVNGHDTEVVNLMETEELIVTATVTMSEEEEKRDGDKSDPEPLPNAEATPEPDESSEKIPDPVAALDAEPETAEPEPLPVAKNEPEPLPVQTPLAESAPEPEPEKLAESVPEAEEQTLPEPVALHQPLDSQPPGQEEKAASEQVETKAEPQTTMDTGAEEAAKEAAAGNKVTAEPPKEEPEKKPAVIEKTAGTVSVTEVASEKPTEAENVKPAEDKKEEAEKAVESETLKGAEAVVAEVVSEVVKSEQNNAELEKEEDVEPVPDSMSFALLEREQTKDTLRTSRTLVVLRGLPGSGKSFLARAIADAYKDHCSVICADDHGVKPEDPETHADGHKALDEAVVSCCGGAGATSAVLIVVDDTNHSQDRLARLGEIAEEHHLVALFLEPQTPWGMDPAQLAKKTKRGLEEAQLEAMKGPLEEMHIPLFFGWFLHSSVQHKVKCTSMDFLKTLDTLEAFKKHMVDFTGKAEKEVDLEQYFKAIPKLHCTTKFCDYGKAEGSKEYAQKPAVRESNGSTFELSLSALFVTPRTVGARVSLTEEQLLLWPDDAEKEAEPTVPGAASLPLGSRAHVTLGCAEAVEPVQTGLDLLEILALRQEGQTGEVVEEMELGSLTYYGEGRWLLALREPICAPACFSRHYSRRELEPTKKEPEKKKKPKCAIL